MLFDTKAPATFTLRGATRRPGIASNGGPGHDIFQPPAFASRPSDSRQVIGSPHGRPTGPQGRTQTGLPRSARTSSDRVGCPLYPEDSGAHPAGSPPRPAPAASQRPVPKPRHNIPPCEAPLHEASTRVHSRSPVRSSPRPRPRDGTSDASASPRAPHPAVTGNARHGQGQAIEHGPGTTRSHSIVDPPIRVVHSMRATSRRTASSRCAPGPL